MARSVLLIHHNPLIEQSLARILKQAGFNILSREDGSNDSDDLLCQPKADVALLDGCMLSLYDFMGKENSAERGKIPFVIMGEPVNGKIPIKFKGAVLGSYPSQISLDELINLLDNIEVGKYGDNSHTTVEVH